MIGRRIELGRYCSAISEEHLTWERADAAYRTQCGGQRRIDHVDDIKVSLS
jgi:hypothetical protein